MSEGNNRHETASVSRTDEDRNRSSSRHTRDGIRGSFGSISRRQFLGVTAGSIVCIGSASAEHELNDEEEKAYDYWQTVTDHWGYEATQLDKYHRRFPHRRGEGIDIAVIDTGFDTDLAICNKFEEKENHLKYHVNIDMKTSTCINTTESNDNCEGIHDTMGHGTSITGIIWQAAPNVTYSIIRVTAITPKNLENAVKYAVDVADADVITTSLGGSVEEESEKIRELNDSFNSAAQDAIVVGAAGQNKVISERVPWLDFKNQAPVPVHPSTADDVLSVSSTAENETRSGSFVIYERGSPDNPKNGKPDIAAPGDEIDTIPHSGKSQNSDVWMIPSPISGSSAAAPLVAGIAALLSDHGEPDEIREAILNSTYPVLNDPRGLSGEGAVRIMGAYNRLLGDSTLTVDVVSNIAEAPVAGATVTVNGEQKETDDGGEAYFTLEDGTYTVTVAYEGFEDIKDEVTIEDGDQRVLMTFDEEDEIDDSEEDDGSDDEDESEEPEDEEETDDGEDTDPEDDDGEEETTGELMVSIVGTNGPVSEGDTLEVTAEIENTGDTELTQTIRLFIGTEGGLDFVAMDDETVTVAGGDSQTISLGYEVGTGPDADLIARVIGEDDSDETTIATSDMESSSSEGEESSYLNVF